jgi:hypothetical protein
MPHPTPRLLAVLVGAACSINPAWAQPPAADDGPLRLLHLAQAVGEGPDSPEPWFGRGERVVKGAPFCAEVQHETVQWLANPDGGAPNRIAKTTAWKVCRDGEGRIRQEVERNGVQRVYLRDPVARENWVLEPARKTARRTGALSLEGVDREALRDYAERMREWAREMSERVRRGVEGLGAPPAPPVPPAMPTPPTVPGHAAAPMPAPVIITRSADAREGAAAEVRVIRLPEGSAQALAFDAPQPPGPVQWRARLLAPRGPGSVSPLPAREIEGLRVNGERTTWVIEAGAVGNDKPIQIFREVWTSPELMLTVMSRDFDPRQGEEIYRLRQVKRGEPDAALMRVPADFSRSGMPARAAPGAAPPAG